MGQLIKWQVDRRAELNALFSAIPSAVKAYIAGWVYGDGCLDFDARYSVRSVRMYADQLDGDVLEWAASYFKGKRYVVLNTQGLKQLNVSSDVMYEYCSEAERLWPAIPDWEQFFCGWFHADGHVDRGRYLELYSKSDVLIKRAGELFGDRLIKQHGDGGRHGLGWRARWVLGKDSSRVFDVLRVPAFRHRKVDEMDVV